MGRLGAGAIGAMLLVAALAPIPTATNAAASNDYPLIAAAGDIACDPESDQFNGGLGEDSKCRQMATSDLMIEAGVDAVLPLGDLQYACGGASEFAASYDPSWGRLKDITYPAVGNHEYSTAESECDDEATGYFDYFGPAAGDRDKGYYSYDLGAWHLIALNSACSKVGGCDAGSPQEQWLRADLAANADRCTLAYWHHARWASGNRHGSNDRMGDLVEALYEAQVDVLLTAHDHNYERFAPQDPDGNLDETAGIRQFVVGTGGKSVNGFDSPIANSEIQGDALGVLFMTLRPDGYDWEFRSIPGESFTDSGSADCINAAPEPPPETFLDSGPPEVTTSADATFTFRSSSPPATFECALDGAAFASCSSPHTLTGLAPGPHAFAVRARSPGGLVDQTPAVWTWTVETVGDVVTIGPEADAMVLEGEPDENFGDESVLGVDRSPMEESLLRFALPGLPGTVTEATLRLYANNGSPDGPEVYTSSGWWSESTVTWNDRPPPEGPAIADIGDVPDASWIEVDVTAAFQNAGAVTLVLVPRHDNGIDFRSREAASRPPELVVRYDLAPPPDTIVTSGPPPTTDSAEARFTFTSPDPAASFVCSLDGAPATACASPTVYAGLGEGPHTFSVSATVPGRGTDPTPATWQWTVTGSTETVVLEPVADTTVKKDEPDENFGAHGKLKVDGDPKQRAYVMFDTGGLGHVARATLRLYVTNPTNDGPRVYATDASWDELGVTFATRPPRLGDPVADGGRFTEDTWVEYDVTEAISLGGPTSLELAPDSTNGVYFSSRESSRPPQLVVERATGTPVVTSFGPTADGYVDASDPDDNFGSATKLRVDESPDIQHTYLRFDVDVTGPVTSATLRLYVRNGSSNGPWVGVTDPNWSESSLTWNNRPLSLGGGIANVDDVPEGMWVEYDVTAAVTGAGPVSFRLVGEVSNGVIFSSREGDDPPELIVETGN